MIRLFVALPATPVTLSFALAELLGCYHTFRSAPRASPFRGSISSAAHVQVLCSMDCLNWDIGMESKYRQAIAASKVQTSCSGWCIHRPAGDPRHLAAGLTAWRQRPSVNLVISSKSCDRSSSCEKSVQEKIKPRATRDSSQPIGYSARSRQMPEGESSNRSWWLERLRTRWFRGFGDSYT